MLSSNCTKSWPATCPKTMKTMAGRRREMRSFSRTVRSAFRNGCTSRRPMVRRWPYQTLGRNSELTMETPDHLHRQRTFPVQHLVDAVAPADHRFQVFGGQSHLLHPELDRLDRIGEVERVTLPLVRLDQCDKNVEPLALRSVRSSIHEGLDLLQSP